MEFVTTEEIGAGTFGVVYKGKHKITGEVVAVKKIIIEDLNLDYSSVKKLRRLKELVHPNIISVFDVLVIRKGIFLVCEFLCMNLKNYIDTSRFDEHMIKNYTFQLLKGISFCHQQKVSHKYLKPQNILINQEGTLKITDFGLARPNATIRSYTNEVTTLWYRAPELLMRALRQSTAVDMWSIGCIFAEMVNKVPLFWAECETDQLKRIFRVLGTPDDAVWPGVSELLIRISDFPQWKKKDVPLLWSRVEPEGHDFLEDLLIVNPGDRISAVEALEHYYFSDFNPSLV